MTQLSHVRAWRPSPHERVRDHEHDSRILRRLRYVDASHAAYPCDSDSAVFVLGFAAGPLLCAPLSEIYGRLPIYHVCNVLFVCFNIGCALAPSMNALIVFRFFAGVFGSAPLSESTTTPHHHRASYSQIPQQTAAAPSPT